MEIKVQRHTDLDSLLKAAASIEGRIFYLAGGTDLMVQAHAGVLPPATWLEISDVPQLHGISVEGSELRIGAGVTHHEIMRSQLVQTWAPALAQASANVGGPQIRSRGTIGGNLANASPVADTVPALYSLGAQLHLISQRGERTVAVEEFALAPRRNVLEPGEIIYSINFPCRPGIKGVWNSMAQRESLAISKVNIGVSYVLDPELEEGEHTLEFRAWDVFNNMSSTSLRFNVVKGLSPQLLSVSCTDNPATTSTTFIISHDRAGSNLDVAIDVMDMSGRLLWTHEESGVSTGSAYTVDWDLTVDGGSRLGTGVYLYRVRMSSDGSPQTSKAKKLVIIGNK